jgi:hypothetical protein
MRKATLHTDAVVEMNEAARYYEERAPGLGLSFIEAVERSVDQIIANSEAYQLAGEDIRRKIMKGFPTASCMQSKVTGFESWPLHT